MLVDRQLEPRYGNLCSMAEIQGGVKERQAVNLAPQVELIPGGPASEASKGVGGQINPKTSGFAASRTDELDTDHEAAYHSAVPA